MKFRSDSKSWQISLDFPEELQFCAYIGQHEGFDAEERRPPLSAEEAQWREWWAALPAITSGVRFDRAARRELDASPLELLKRVDPRMDAGFHPPDFTDLASVPGLQRLCRQHWRSFQQAWGGTEGKKLEMIAMMQAQFQNLRLDRLVKEYVQAVGKSTSHPFYLRLDFLQWPENYRREISNNHALLGARFLEPDRIEELRAILKAFMIRLV